MIWLARCAVLIAAITTLYFNGSYAWNTADATHGKAGFVAMALAIDLCKITFLGAATWCWGKRLYLRALVLLLIWPLAFSASTFMAYSAITTQKTTAAAVTDGLAGDRLRLQDRYDGTRQDLATAKADTNWRDTSSCTRPRIRSHRAYCERVASLQTSLDTLADQLGPAPTITAQQDLTQLAATTGMSVAQIAFLAAFLPALLLELIASLGSYAVGAKNFANGSRKPVEPILQKEAVAEVARGKTGSRRDSEAVTGNPQPQPTKQPAPPPRVPRFPKVARS